MIYYKLTLKHWLSFGFIAICIIIASIQPLEYSSYFLHQIGTLLMLIALWICVKKIGLTFASFILCLTFLIIHILGAHYLYSYVPYNDWFIHFLNFDLNQSMGWTRNMYDRLVHFAYGFLLYPLFLRIFQVYLPTISSKILYILVVQFVMTTSLFYEWIEWLIAIGLSPEEAENYNGQQGDIWDAHKDMLIATIGAIISGFIILKTNHKKALI